MLGMFGKKNNENACSQQKLNMFCYQCEQTPKGGCTKIGVCGKNLDIASLQDTGPVLLRG